MFRCIIRSTRTVPGHIAGRDSVWKSGHVTRSARQCNIAVLTGQGCSALPRPPWRTAVTSVETAAGWTSLLAWTWWRTGPTRWNPGTPERQEDDTQVNAWRHNTDHRDGERDTTQQLQANVWQLQLNGLINSPNTCIIQRRISKFQGGRTLIGDIIAARVPKHKRDYAFSEGPYSRNVLMK